MPEEIKYEIMELADEMPLGRVLSIYAERYPMYRKEIKILGCWIAAGLYGHGYPESL